MINKNEQIDVLVIGAHPDDAEAGAGGLLLACHAKGKKTGILCVSDGGHGARGTAEERIGETQRAAEILNVDMFEILGQEDTNISAERVWVEKMEQMLIRSRPKLIITHSPNDWNPDHRHTWELVDAAWALANRQGRHGDAYMPKPVILQFSFDYLRTAEPKLLVDISPWFSRKQQAISAHESQAEILEKLLHLNEFWGSLIGTNAAEAFYSIEPIVLSSELGLV